MAPSERVRSLGRAAHPGAAKLRPAPLKTNELSSPEPAIRVTRSAGSAPPSNRSLDHPAHRRNERPPQHHNPALATIHTNALHELPLRLANPRNPSIITRNME